MILLNMLAAGFAYSKVNCLIISLGKSPATADLGLVTLHIGCARLDETWIILDNIVLKYDIRYNDGDEENNVPNVLIRLA